MKFQIPERSPDGLFYQRREVSIACYEGKHEQSSWNPFASEPFSECDLPYCECACHRAAATKDHWMIATSMSGGLLLFLHFILDVGWVGSTLIGIFIGIYSAQLVISRRFAERRGGMEMADLIERKFHVRLPSKEVRVQVERPSDPPGDY